MLRLTRGYKRVIRNLELVGVLLINFVIEGRSNLPTHIHKLMNIVMGQVRNQEEINKAFKRVLEEKVQENACDHDANNVS